jgi:hypothetical protein
MNGKHVVRLSATVVAPRARGQQIVGKQSENFLK